MRKRILSVLAMILIFRILAHLPIPVADGATLKQILESSFANSGSAFINQLDVLSGGALGNFSIMLVGLGPYINASIIMQLLTHAIPKLEELNKEGEFGRKKINQYTRILALPLAIVQSIGTIYFVREAASATVGLGDITAGSDLANWILMIGALVGGSMLLMFLGEQITEQGIGNGISLVITIGIVSQLPSTIQNVFQSAQVGSDKLSLFGWQTPFTQEGAIFIGILAFSILLLTAIIVKLNEASRNLTINYAKRVQGNRAYGGITTNLPIKLISAGVIPVIFASVFLTAPAFIGQILSQLDNESWQQLGLNLQTWFQSPTREAFSQGGLQPYIYPAIYFGLVFAFTFFYTSLNFKANEIAENLQKQGGFIEGIRSGKQTEKYLSGIVNKLTLFGAVSLGLLAVAPVIGQAFVTIQISTIGTSLLILVAVSLETLRQVESRALMVTYDHYEEPDFFYEQGPGTADKRLRLGKRFSRKKKSK
ncbi:MAG: preprotein translocase subunit SecY [bacterium]|nr:preprotein translocase subunit SecY [bacterium]